MLSHIGPSAKALQALQRRGPPIQHHYPGRTTLSGKQESTDRPGADSDHVLWPHGWAGINTVTTRGLRMCVRAQKEKTYYLFKLPHCSATQQACCLFHVSLHNLAFLWYLQYLTFFRPFQSSIKCARSCGTAVLLL